jgi:hypothetical protein
MHTQVITWDHKTGGLRSGNADIFQLQPHGCKV